MLFRSSNGKLENINKYDLIDDKKYYDKIIQIHKKFNHENYIKSNHNDTVKRKLLSKI